MGVMSIPCCDISATIPPVIVPKTGPVLVRAGWYHFLVMSKGGEVTTFIGSPPLVYKTGVTGDYWQTRWGDTPADPDPTTPIDPTKEADRTIWPPQGSEYIKGNWWQKFGGGIKKYHPWSYADCSYHLGITGWDSGCIARSTNITDGKIGEHGTLIVNATLEPTNDGPGYDFVGIATGLEGSDDPPKCTEKCYYEVFKWYEYPGSDNNKYIREFYPEIITDYINLDGSYDGLGVTLYEATQCSKGLPKYVTPYSAAQIAPVGHPLETPTNIPGPVVDIVCGAYHNIIKLFDNSIMAWGLNSMGQSNVPESLLPDSLRPITVPPHPKKSKICSLHAGYSTSAVLFNDGTVLCWGDPEVSAAVNQWKHIRTSVIKLFPTDGQQKSCIGAGSEGYPECLPGEDCTAAENWVVQDKIKNGSYNAQNDWNGEWHGGAAPAYPHFDLGVETEYVYPVNWGHVADFSSGSVDKPAGYVIPGDTDEEGVDVPQYSYRYAKKWASLGGNQSLCSQKNKIVKDYAVGMLRTGQIVTTRKTNAPESGKNLLYSRDCNMDAHTSRSDGVITVTNKGPAINFRARIGSDNQTCSDANNNCFGDNEVFNCSTLSTPNGPYKECLPTTTICEAYKRWELGDNGGCEDNGPSAQNRPEGIGCFCSADDEDGYDPNWAGADLIYKSAGHVRKNYPGWNSAESTFGWSSLPVIQSRFIPTPGFYESIRAGCRGIGAVTTTICQNYFPANLKCGSECPSSDGIGGNIIADPGKRGAGILEGTPGYFTYPTHMNSQGCVAGTNTVSWLSPPPLFPENLFNNLPFYGVDGTRTNFQNQDTLNNQFPQSNGEGPNKTVRIGTRNLTSGVFDNGRRNGNVCRGCDHVGSHREHKYNIHRVTHGVIFNINEKDPDGAINPFTGGSKCGVCETETDPGTRELGGCNNFRPIILPQYSMRPSKSWGPFNIEKHIGMLPTPPVLELGIWRYGNQLQLWSTFNSGRSINENVFNFGYVTEGLVSFKEGFDESPGTVNSFKNTIPTSTIPWMYILAQKGDQQPTQKQWQGGRLAFEITEMCDQRNCWADDELNGLGTALGGDGMGCAMSGAYNIYEPHSSMKAFCAGEFKHSCADPIKTYNPNKKQELLNSRGFTLYSPPEPVYQKSPEISSISKDKSKIAILSRAENGIINLFVWDITSKANKKLIKFNAIESVMVIIKTPYKMKWLEDNTLLVMFNTPGDRLFKLSAIIISNFMGSNYKIKPVKFTREYKDRKDNNGNPISNFVYTDYITCFIENGNTTHQTINSNDINSKDGTICTLYDTTTVDQGTGFMRDYNKQHVNIWKNNTSVPINGNQNRDNYVYYKLCGVNTVNEMLDVVRHTTFFSRTLGNPDGVTLSPARGKNLNDGEGKDIHAAVTNDRIPVDTLFLNENIYMRAGGYAQTIHFNSLGDLMLSSNTFKSVVCWGLKGITSETKQDGESEFSRGELNPNSSKLLLDTDIDDTNYTQTFNNQQVAIEQDIESGSEEGAVFNFNYNLSEHLGGVDAEHVKSNTTGNKIAIFGWDNTNISASLQNSEKGRKVIQINKLIWGTTLEAYDRGAKIRPNPATPPTIKDIIPAPTTIEKQIDIYEDGFTVNRDHTGDSDFRYRAVNMMTDRDTQSFSKYLSIDDTLNFAIVIDILNDRGGDNNQTARCSFIHIDVLANKINRFFNVFPETTQNSYSGVELIKSDMAVILSLSVRPYKKPIFNITTDIEIPNVYVFDGKSLPSIYKLWPLRNRRICGWRQGLGSPPPLGWTGGGNFECCGARDNSCGPKIITPDKNPGDLGWVKPTECNKQVQSKGLNDVLCPDCEQDNTDEYSRWAFLNYTISYATGRSWSVHLRAKPWDRKRDKGSFFLKVNNCEETSAYNSNEFFDDGGITIQKSPNHISGNYDNVKIWVVGDLTDPCPPWPLKTWNSEFDIDIDKPRASTTVGYTVQGGKNHTGNQALNGISGTFNIKYCPLYPSWVPTPNSGGPHNTKPRQSYKGSWGVGGDWKQALYGIKEGKLNGKNVSECGLNIQSISDIESINSSIGRTDAAYQDTSCGICEKSWTSPLPPESDIVGKVFFKQGFESPWSVDGVGSVAATHGTQYKQDDTITIDALPICNNLKLGSCWRPDATETSGWTCSYGSINACSHCPDSTNPNDAGYFRENELCANSQQPQETELFDEEGEPIKRGCDVYNRWCCECPPDQPGCGCGNDQPEE